MGIKDLTRSQIRDIKQAYYSLMHFESVTWQALFNIDDYISDETIFKVYEGVKFDEC